MKRLVPIFAVLAGPVLAAGDESIIRFANKDRLSGSLESISGDQVVWNSQALEKPLPFFQKQVLDITLPGSVPQLDVDHVAILTLTNDDMVTNGDVVRGQLVSVTDTAITLDTWFAGRMNFNRRMVKSVRIEGRTEVLYRGPTGLDGWRQSGDEPPAWYFARSAFRSKGRGSIARDGVLPDECAVRFDVAWKSDSLSMKVVLFSDEPDSDNPASGYELSFQGSSVYLRNCKTQGFLGSNHSQALAENEKIHVEVRASRTTGKVGLFIDNQVVEVWNDGDVRKGRFGSGLHFVSQNTYPLKISDIEVAEWDSTEDRLPEPRVGMMRQFGLRGMAQDPRPASGNKIEEGKMELANGDLLDGEVESIEAGVITVKSSLGEVKVPVARVRNIALKKVDLERCIRRKGDVRAWFPDGSSLVFRLDAVGDGTVAGSSQNFGNATFKRNAFSRVEFNIYDPSLEGNRPDEEW